MRRYIPARIEDQLMAVLALSFSTLLSILALFEVLEQDDVVDWAHSDYSAARLGRILPVLPLLREGEAQSYIKEVSRCHEGYTLTKEPYPVERQSNETIAIQAFLADVLNLNIDNISTGLVTFTEHDFSYGSCSDGEIVFPVQGIVLSIKSETGQWLNAEIHPHKWHFTPSFTQWIVRSSLTFALVALVAWLFVRRIGRPLQALTQAARSFGRELKVEEVDATGPTDLKRAIQSFNTMQAHVAHEVQRRTVTLAAIGHDIRSPLTALRLKAELVRDNAVRDDLLTSVGKMERITRSALEYLKGDSRGEQKKQVDISSLVESECSDFSEEGADIVLECEDGLSLLCRPDALCRAVRNIIENAIKYAGHAEVTVYQRDHSIVIAVADHGPGIPSSLYAAAMQPFERLSDARESETGGFGLGLASAKAIAEGHDGVLAFTENTPRGLIVSLSLPIEGGTD
ncbi:MAG: ATP-binding protein [Pseudomonadota bacterium]